MLRQRQWNHVVKCIVLTVHKLPSLHKLLKLTVANYRYVVKLLLLCIGWGGGGGGGGGGYSGGSPLKRLKVNSSVASSWNGSFDDSAHIRPAIEASCFLLSSFVLLKDDRYGFGLPNVLTCDTYPLSLWLRVKGPAVGSLFPVYARLSIPDLTAAGCASFEVSETRWGICKQPAASIAPIFGGIVFSYSLVLEETWPPNNSSSLDFVTIFSSVWPSVRFFSFSALLFSSLTEQIWAKVLSCRRTSDMGT